MPRPSLAPSERRQDPRGLVLPAHFTDGHMESLEKGDVSVDTQKRCSSQGTNSVFPIPHCVFVILHPFAP